MRQLSCQREGVRLFAYAIDVCVCVCVCVLVSVWESVHVSLRLQVILRQKGTLDH